MKLIGVLALCAAVSIVRAREEALEQLPKPEAHLMRVPSTSTTTLAPTNDCESMDKCNLTDAVPGNDGPKFSEMGQQEKLKVCRALKKALDCSSLFYCDRLTRLFTGGERFFKRFCTKIFHENGLTSDNCVRSVHTEAVDRCALHLEKMQQLANHVSPNEEAVQQACCEHRMYTDCYRREVSARCSVDLSDVPLHPDRKVDMYCSKDYTNDPAALCREQRQLNFDSVQAGISASSALFTPANSGSAGIGFVTCFAVILLRVLV
ncbi:uncharacterized protein LOC111262212 isoform X1 [Varroa jacobsoni]|uniref:uncharacterized protein LOC111262212 isoform X1 n=1 Tax=Varroa jacobsoni TaxID=62625 RepID=UPI000BF3D15B|nr:uncharacterized protein LOC111262212 isoform X1 [Varroa jacobsoni]